jgi:hypothetical protein
MQLGAAQLAAVQLGGTTQTPTILGYLLVKN